MAVIHDVMPAFELVQPTSVDGALALLERHGAAAWVLAGGMDTFDWLKDRTKRPAVVVDLSGIEALRGIRPYAGGLEIGGDDTAERGGGAPDGAAAVWAADGGGGLGGVAADPEPGDARGEREPGYAVLVLPRGLELLPGRGQHLLRGHADGDEPGARDFRGGPMCGGEPVGYGAGAGGAGGADGDPAGEPRAGGGGGRLLCGARVDITRMSVLAPGDLLTANPDPGDVGGGAVLL